MCSCAIWKMNKHEGPLKAFGLELAGTMRYTNEIPVMRRREENAADNSKRDLQKQRRISG